MKQLITLTILALCLAASAQTNITANSVRQGHRTLSLSCVDPLYQYTWVAFYTNGWYQAKSTNETLTISCTNNNCVVFAHSLTAFINSCGSNTTTWSSFYGYLKDTNYQFTVYGQDPVPTNVVTLHLNSGFIP